MSIEPFKLLRLLLVAALVHICLHLVISINKNILLGTMPMDITIQLYFPAL